MMVFDVRKGDFRTLVEVVKICVEKFICETICLAVVFQSCGYNDLSSLMLSSSKVEGETICPSFVNEGW